MEGLNQLIKVRYGEQKNLSLNNWTGTGLTIKSQPFVPTALKQSSLVTVRTCAFLTTWHPQIMPVSRLPETSCLNGGMVLLKPVVTQVGCLPLSVSVSDQEICTRIVWRKKLMTLMTTLIMTVRMWKPLRMLRMVNRSGRRSTAISSTKRITKN